MNHDMAAARDRKLTRGDAHISRCPSCGSWTWRGACPLTTEHDITDPNVQRTPYPAPTQESA